MMVYGRHNNDSINIMKIINSKILTIAAFTLLISPIVSAENANVGTQVNAKPSIKEQIRAEIQLRTQDSDDEEKSETGIANTMKREGVPAQLREEARERIGTTSPKIGTSTNSRVQANLRKEIRLQEFKNEQAKIVKQLEKNISNLNETRTKIGDRIILAEKSGRDMTKAKAALVIADAKISLAVSSLVELRSYIASTSTSLSASTTDNISLEKPRTIATKVIIAIKTAKNALNDVVIAIARDMGFRIGINNRITVGIGTTTMATTMATTTTATTTSTTTP